jgi:hypothetical protein
MNRAAFKKPRFQSAIPKILVRKEARGEPVTVEGECKIVAPAPRKALAKKAPRRKSMGHLFVELVDLREEAKGKFCQVRLPGCRGYATEYTVLAHLRVPGICGTALKPPDTCGAWSCDHCHDCIDGRKPFPKVSMKQLSIEQMLRQIAHYEGQVRTLFELHQLGYRMRKAP